MHTHAPSCLRALDTHPQVLNTFPSDDRLIQVMLAQIPLHSAHPLQQALAICLGGARPREARRGKGRVPRAWAR